MFSAVSLDDSTPSSSRFAVNSSKYSDKSRNQFPDAGMLVSSRRVVARLDEVSSDVSCGKDVEDVLALELQEPVDNPWTSIGTQFSVFHWMFFHFFKCVVFDH